MSMTTRALVVCAIAISLSAQVTNQFEVADVHPSVRADGIRMPFINSEMRGGYIRGGRYELQHATIADLIGVAQASMRIRWLAARAGSIPTNSTSSPKPLAMQQRKCSGRCCNRFLRNVSSWLSILTPDRFLHMP